MSFLSSMRQRQPGRELWRVVAWHFLQFHCFLVLLILYRYRAWGIRNIPYTGPVLFVGNHQSFLDPALIGVGANRRHFFALGRSTLYGNWFTGFMGILTNSIPVEQGAGDVKAIKQCIDVLKNDHGLLIFPEGARTNDGKTHKFESGTMLIIKRAKPTIVPFAVDGPYQIWPRKQFLPRFSGRMGIMYGKPIPAETILSMKADDAMTMLRQHVVEMRQQVTQRLNLEPLESVDETPTAAT